MPNPQNVSQTVITKDSGVVILLLGHTGVGKSTFINAAVGESVAAVNHALTSEELGVRHFIVKHPRHSRRSFVFIDTPGFDDTYKSDAEILKQIIDWLKDSCRSDVSFGGIVYLHDISKDRMQLTLGSLIPMRLRRPEPARHVVLTTTKWGKVDSSCAELREQEVKAAQWKDLLTAGAHIDRFRDTTQDSAWSIIDTLPNEPLKLHIIQKALKKIYDSQPSSTLTPAPVGNRGFFAWLFRSRR